MFYDEKGSVPNGKWVGIVYEAAVGGVDRFTVTPYIADPTKGPIV